MGRIHASMLCGSRRSSPAPRLKAVAASCIDYACVPLSEQAGWARAEACWIIYMLALAFTELWAEFKGKSWRANFQDLSKPTDTLLQLRWVGGAERFPKAITQSGAKMSVRDTPLPLPMTHPPALYPRHLLP